MRLIKSWNPGPLKRLAIGFLASDIPNLSTTALIFFMEQLPREVLIDLVKATRPMEISQPPPFSATSLNSYHFTFNYNNFFIY
jgi:hypothetical protein